MSEVSITVELSVEVDPNGDPVELEESVAAQGREAARALYGEAIDLLDKELVRLARGARQRAEQRWLATSFGRMRISRYRVKADGESFHPLDAHLQLRSGEASPAFRELISEIALRLPYRQAAALVSRILGEPLSPQSCWRILQQGRLDGGSLRASDDVTSGGRPSRGVQARFRRLGRRDGADRIAIAKTGVAGR